MRKPKPPAPRKLRKRAPTLTSHRVAGIAAIIRQWRGRLTWDGLCAEIEGKTGARYTRQALNNHIEIKAAYAAYKEKPTPRKGENESTKAEQKIQALQRQVQELETIRDALLEKFVRWSVNASSRGLNEQFLDQPLRRINRSGNLQV